MAVIARVCGDDWFYIVDTAYSQVFNGRYVLLTFVYRLAVIVRSWGDVVWGKIGQQMDVKHAAFVCFEYPQIVHFGLAACELKALKALNEGIPRIAPFSHGRYSVYVVTAIKRYRPKPPRYILPPIRNMVHYSGLPYTLVLNSAVLTVPLFASCSVHA